jgi:peptidoglycan/LPS O-acetylase OafA/YrhL
MNKRIVYLDVLRAIAVLMVIGGHLEAAPETSAALISWISEWFRRYGSLGVDLFFVLSGFLVSGLLFREYQAHGNASVGRFLLRRGLKIYPAFYFFLIVTVLIRLRMGGQFTVSQLVCESLFLQNYGPSVWSHTWSLAVEEHFYLLLAGLFAIINSRHRENSFRYVPIVFLITAICVGIARLATFVSIPYSTKSHRFPTHLQLDSLLFGVFLSYLYHARARFKERIAEHPWATICLGLLVSVIAQNLTAGGLRYVLGHVLTYVGFGFVVVGSVCLKEIKNRYLKVPIVALAVVGSFSYSIYLWHTILPVLEQIFVRRVTGSDLNYYWASLLAIASSICFGILIAKCVELPVLRFRDRWIPAHEKDISHAVAPAAVSPIATQSA